MKLTQIDTELFKVLSKSQIGKDLTSYLERLSDYVCDVRSWGPQDTKESSQRVAKIIEENILNKILHAPKKKGGISEDYT